MSSTTVNWINLAVAGDRYRVTAELGAGGMAQLYRAYDQHLETEVVIKVPQLVLLGDPTFAARFRREVRALVHLSHPHVVKILDVGEHDGVPFAVIQYLAGGSVANRAMALQKIRSWLPQIADALDFVHAQGYVHRDVKPGNILFDTHGNAYLSDFGIVKAAADNDGPQNRTLTRTGMVVGTPQYMAPELILGETYDGRSDQYSLAVVLYEVLTGKRPFDGPTSTAILVQQSTVVPRSLHDIKSDISPQVSRAVAVALAKNPLERHPDCRSLAAALVGAPKPAAPQPSVRASATRTWTAPAASAVVISPSPAPDPPSKGVLVAVTPAAPPAPPVQIDTSTKSRADTDSKVRKARRTVSRGKPALGRTNVEPSAHRRRKATVPPTWWLAGLLAAGLLVAGVIAFSLPDRAPGLSFPLKDYQYDEWAEIGVAIKVREHEDWGGRLKYTLVNGPESATLTPDKALLRWRPGEEHGGRSHSFTIRVEGDWHGKTHTSETTFRIKVDEVNDPPQFPSHNLGISIQAGTLLLQEFAATDPDDPPNSLTVHLPANPFPGAQFDAKTGILRWVPDASLAGQAITARVDVTDPAGKQDTLEFTVEVTP